MLVTISLVVVLAALTWYIARQNDRIQSYKESNMRQAEHRINVETDAERWRKEAIDNANNLALEQEKNKEIISQKKSSETRLGQVTEHLVPFLEDCRHDPKNMHFLGQPVDYIVFDFDQGEITFVEVKTGNAKESHRQKTIKNIIKSGKVFYETMRINAKGVVTKKQENQP